MKRYLIAGGAFGLLPLILFGQLPCQAGWPQGIHGSMTSNINIADVDDDGQKELVFGDRSFGGQGDWWLYIKAMDGTDKPGWPINLAGTDQAQVLFDSNDDGKHEIVNAAGDLFLRRDDGSAIWSVPYSGPIFQSLYYPYNVSVADLDNDGLKEIVVTCLFGGAVFVFDAQGNVRPGWPVIIPPHAGWAPPPIYKAASIGDIDQDGQKEIVVGVDDGTFTDPSQVFCFKPDGTSCLGFPVGTTRQGYRSQAVLLDIDGDGYLEIIISKETTQLNVYRYDGSLFPGYPLAQSARGIAVGDVDLDGDMDMLTQSVNVRGNDLITGAVLPNFPFIDPAGTYRFSGFGAPNICDLSDDTGLEIVAGGITSGLVRDGRLFAFNLNGQVLSGFPSVVLSHRALEYGCAINDLDGDGDTEICCGSTNDEFGVPRPSTVYCWDSPHPYNLDNVDWAMDGFDLGHTGRWRKLYHINKVLSPLSLVPCRGQGDPCYLPPDGSLIAVDVTAIRQFGGANPAGQDVRYSRTLGCGNYEGPVIDHGDGTYTRMLRAPTADCTTDVHAWVNEFKLQDYQQIIFTSGCVIPPPAFNLLNPADGAVQQPLNVTLEWPVVGTFPNQATSYDLYFGTVPDPPIYQSGLTTPYFDLHNLALGTTYYWRVEARNACGATSSPVWSFTTACPAPEPFVNLCPADRSTGLPLEVELAWEASAHAESYKVYLGTDPSMLAFVSSSIEPRATLHGLALGVKYYWQIAAQNPCGETMGPVWSFTTGTEEECRHCRPVSPP